MDLILLVSSLCIVLSILHRNGVEGSIHTYKFEPFNEVGNAFLLSGGSEGIVASDSNSYIK
jgi:hypothetical protein